MPSQLLDNIKTYISEQKEQIQNNFECTQADYANNLNALYKDLNTDWNTDYDSWDFDYNIYEI